MRALMFRGKTIRDDRWVISDSISQERGKVYLYDEVKDIDVEVNPETVGQYTGMTDKNGVNIFEGDIIWGDSFEGDWHKGVVEYDELITSFIVNAKQFMHYSKNTNCYSLCGRWTIEGNKYDHGDLV